MRIDSTLCGNKPVSKVARLGMHHEPRYERSNLTPLAASRSMLGVCTQRGASG